MDVSRFVDVCGANYLVFDHILKQSPAPWFIRQYHIFQNPRCKMGHQQAETVGHLIGGCSLLADA